MTRRWARSRAAIGVGAFAMLLATGTVAAMTLDQPAAAPSEVAARVQPPSRSVVIGDSAIAALRWVPGADNAIVGFEHVLDLESCRRLVQTSCFGREQRRPPTLYDALDTYGGRTSTLIVATGYNDGPGTFAASFEAIVAKARALRFTRIVWWTLRSDVDYVSPGAIGNHETFAENNAVLRSLVDSGRFPDVVIADWGGYTADRPEWFVTDGVHYRQVGTWGAADYLTRKMAFLEGRPCPFATSPNQEPANPCPDPDVTGPVTDIEALYPIGEDGVLCYEIGEDRRVECRLDTHVIQLERELGFGASGSDVWALQTRLERLGLLGASPNGNFGPSTEAGVRAFQTSEGLPPSGFADVATLAALGFDTSGITP